MANWKKMAEAFGRALGQSGGTIKEDLNKAERSVLEAGYNHRDDALGDDFRKGARAGTADRIDAEARAETAQDEGVGGSLKQLTDDELDHINDVRTDEALETQRQKEWDDAFKSAKEHVKRGYGDSYPEDMAGEGADAFEKQLWDVIDDLKAQGRSVEDILGALKSMGTK